MSCSSVRKIIVVLCAFPLLFAGAPRSPDSLSTRLNKDLSESEIVRVDWLSKDYSNDVLTEVGPGDGWLAITRSAPEYSTSQIEIYFPKGSTRTKDEITSFGEEGKYEADLVLSKDGKRAVYVSSRPTGQVGITDAWNLFVTVHTLQATFGASSPFLFNSTESECCLVFADDGRAYFASNRNGSWDIFVADFDGDSFRNLRPAAGKINSARPEWPSFVYSGGDVMLLSSIRPGGHGADDLWIARRCGGDWGAAVRLPAPYNTPQNEDNAKVFFDRILVWSSNREDLSDNGTADIYAANFDPRELVSCPG